MLQSSEERKIAEKERTAFLRAANLSAFEKLSKRIQEGDVAPAVATGFPQLDKALGGGLYPGLYLLGAVSSLGKTTFISQIADFIAANGRDVLFFSLEMSVLELTCKSISRLTFEICDGDLAKAKTYHEVRNSGANKKDFTAIDIAIAAYTRSGAPSFRSNIEGTGGVRMEKIRDAVSACVKQTGQTPVVFIDYLQLLAATTAKTNERQGIDRAVLELKQISRDFDIPIVAISSLNRSSYDSAATMSSFKESGSIEYSADVLMTLQPSDVTYDTDAKGKKENAEALRLHRADSIRSVDVCILKNRNAEVGSKVPFTYHAPFNFFAEVSPRPAQSSPRPQRRPTTRL